MKAILGILATIIAIAGYIPYIKDTFSGKTKPHIFSWFLWGLVSLIAFGIQVTNKGGFGSIPNLVMVVICGIIFWRSIRNGTKTITKIDILSLVLAIFSVGLWLIVKQPLMSMIIIIVVDIFSIIPTLTKSWKNPYSETLTTWIVNCVRQVLITLSLGEINLITVSYPIYALIANVVLCGIIIFQRKRISPVS